MQCPTLQCCPLFICYYPTSDTRCHDFSYFTITVQNCVVSYENSVCQFYITQVLFLLIFATIRFMKFCSYLLDCVKFFILITAAIKSRTKIQNNKLKNYTHESYKFRTIFNSSKNLTLNKCFSRITSVTYQLFDNYLTF